MKESKAERTSIMQAFVHTFNLVIVVVMLSLLAFGVRWYLAVAVGAVLVVVELLLGGFIIGRKRDGQTSSQH